MSIDMNRSNIEDQGGGNELSDRYTDLFDKGYGEYIMVVRRDKTSAESEGMTVREKLDRWMKETRTGQVAVASTANIVQSTLSHFLQGKTKQPSYPFLIGIANTMGCDLEWLLDESKGWPLVKRGESRETHLPDSERKALDLIQQVDSAFGPGSAIRRLLSEPAMRKT